MATDAYQKEHECDAEKLAAWPLNDEYYRDVEYVSEQLAFHQRGHAPVMFDAILETLSYLPYHCGRFQKVRGMWVISRLQELLEMFPSDKKPEGRW